MDLATLNWLAIGAAVIVGQIVLTVWFLVLFGTQWAQAYGVQTRAEHTAAIPGSAYGIGLACTVVVVLGQAVLQQALGVSGLGGALGLGLGLAVAFAAATALPGYVFLKRVDAGMLAIGSQVAMILCTAAVLGLWPAG